MNLRSLCPFDGARCCVQAGPGIQVDSPLGDHREKEAASSEGDLVQNKLISYDASGGEILNTESTDYSAARGNSEFAPLISYDKTGSGIADNIWSSDNEIQRNPIYNNFVNFDASGVDQYPADQPIAM